MLVILILIIHKITLSFFDFRRNVQWNIEAVLVFEEGNHSCYYVQKAQTNKSLYLILQIKKKHTKKRSTRTTYSCEQFHNHTFDMELDDYVSQAFEIIVHVANTDVHNR